MRLLPFILPLLVLLQACSGKTADPATTDDTVPVTVMTLHTSSSPRSVNVPGAFSTDDETVLSFLSAGIIGSIAVKEGETVRAGQVLATLEPTSLDAQLQQAQSGADKSARDLQRAEALHRDSVVSLEQLQNARTALEVAQQQLTAARYLRGHAEIRATRDGSVLRKFVNSGELVAAGTPVLAVNGAGRGEWILKAGLSDKDWARVQVGDSAVVRADAFPDRAMNAVVSNKSMGADQRSGAFLLELSIADNTAQGLASGLYGKATIRTRDARRGIAVPFEAVLDGDGDQGFVFLAGSDGKAHRQAVDLLGFTGQHVIIAGVDTLKPLIVNGGAYLTDGSTIKIR